MAITMLKKCSQVMSILLGYLSLIGVYQFTVNLKSYFCREKFPERFSTFGNLSFLAICMFPIVCLTTTIATLLKKRIAKILKAHEELKEKIRESNASAINNLSREKREKTPFTQWVRFMRIWTPILGLQSLIYFLKFRFFSVDDASPAEARFAFFTQIVLNTAFLWRMIKSFSQIFASLSCYYHIQSIPVKPIPVKFIPKPPPLPTSIPTLSPKKESPRATSPLSPEKLARVFSTLQAPLTLSPDPRLRAAETPLTTPIGTPTASPQVSSKNVPHYKRTSQHES